MLLRRQFWGDYARTKARLLSYPAMTYPHTKTRSWDLPRAEALENYDHFLATKRERAELVVAFTSKWESPVRRDLGLDETANMAAAWLLKYSPGIKPTRYDYGGYTRATSILHDLGIVVGDRIIELSPVPGWHFHEDDTTPRGPTRGEIEEERLDLAKEAEWNPDVPADLEPEFYKPRVHITTRHQQPAIGGGGYDISCPLKAISDLARGIFGNARRDMPPSHYQTVMRWHLRPAITGMYYKLDTNADE